MNRVKMSDLHIELTMDTDPFARNARIISKHLQAMADELELAAQLEESPSPEEPQVRNLCDHCGRPLGSTIWGKWGRTYCSAGCLEMAGMGPAVQTIRIDAPDAILIPELVDAVILRLLDCFGMKIEE